MQEHMVGCPQFVSAELFSRQNAGYGNFFLPGVYLVDCIFSLWIPHSFYCNCLLQLCNDGARRYCCLGAVTRSSRILLQALRVAVFILFCDNGKQQQKEVRLT